LEKVLEDHYNDDDIEKKTDDVFSFFYAQSAFSSYSMTA